MKKRRIGVAISTHHARLQDQQLYTGVRDYSVKNPGFECILAPFAAEDLKSAQGGPAPFDGVLGQATEELVMLSREAGIPVVDVWRDSLVREPISCVFPDFAQAGRMVGQHLVSRGFENFGFVINRRSQYQATMCDDTIMGGDALGFASYVVARGFKCARFLAPHDVGGSAGAWRNWTRRIRAWLIAQPKPLGLFVPNDLLCRHIADIAPELDLNVPHDLGLVCADNEPNLCRLSNPSLTSVDLGYKRVGFEAASLLDGLLTKKSRKRKREIRLIEPHALHPRSSTDATTVKDPFVSAAMRYILEHTHEPIKVSDVAASVSTTRRTLERRFREVLDRTVGQEITRCRIERLKRRLAESDTPIKILAIDSGFNSARVLYETFVREEGMSPSAYRAKRRTGKR